MWGINIPSPIGDIVGNCLVIAGNLWSQCVDGESPVKDTQWNKEQESNYVIEEEQRDLDKIGNCDQSAQDNSPFTSPILWWPTAVRGKPSSAQATTTKIQWKDRGYQDTDVGQSDSVGINVNGQDLLLLERENLVGGTDVDLKVEGGAVKWLRQCLIQDWMEDQQAYFANNALSMHMQGHPTTYGSTGIQYRYYF